MKISKETLALLRNFAAINSNILLKPGNVLSTLSASKTIYAKVTVKEQFTHQFGIYDLNEVLGIASLFSDPDFEFNEKFLIVREGGSSVKYFAAAEEVLVVPSKPLNVPPADIEFNLSADQLTMILKTAGVLRAPDVCIEGNGTTLRANVCDKKNPSSNSYIVELGATDETFKANLRVDNLKMMMSNYTVQLAAKKIAKFVSNDLEYVVVLEQDSEF